MIKSSTRVDVSNFIKGLITEASPLNYPANACVDIQNFELNRDGSLDRRLGVGMETGYTLRSTPLPDVDADTAQIRTFRWYNANGEAENDFLVVQVEKHLYFHRINTDVISADGYIGTIELTSFPANKLYSFAAPEGKLIVVAGTDTVAQVEWDGTTFSVTYSSILVRDQWGVEVTGIPSYETDVTYRGAYDAKHYYNLQNQSWGIPRKDSTGTSVDPVNKYFTDLAKYPSNSELVWAGLEFQPVSGGSTFERMYTNLYEDTLGADVIAARGYYVIDLLKRGTSREAAFAANYAKYPVLTVSSVTLPDDITSNGATVVHEFAGRVWYAGFSGDVTDGDKRSPNLSNYIAFSRLIRSSSDFYKCHQEGDPSSRDSSDVLDTDGGLIRIEGASRIIAMFTLEFNLVVIADNGVWAITGGSDYGFTPTNYRVSKLSNFGGIAPRAVVVENNRGFYWSDSGIYVVAKDQFGSLVVENITQQTIQTFYENIPNTSKLNCVGVYDMVSKKVRWLYNTGTRFTNSSQTYELVLDTVISAFYVHKIQNLSTYNVEAVSLFQSTPFERGEVLTPVYVGSALVYSDTDAVGIQQSVRDAGTQSTKFLVVQTDAGVIKYTVGLFNNTSFLDWEEVDGTGVDAAGYILPGHATGGDSGINKQIPYVLVFFRRTERGVDPDTLVPLFQSGCFMRCHWDFSNSINSKKWSELVQVYRYRRARFVEGPEDDYDTGFEIIYSKNKVRGRGRAFSVYFETEPSKDCRLVGWNLSVNGNVNV